MKSVLPDHADPLELTRHAVEEFAELDAHNWRVADIFKKE